MRKLTFLFVTCMILGPCLGESSTSSEQMIDLGSHRLQVLREGRGAPTVVIDTGLGDQLDKLKGLQELVSRVTLVISYNRAGYGKSEAGPLPRDSGREAEELKDLLAKAAHHLYLDVPELVAESILSVVYEVRGK